MTKPSITIADLLALGDITGADRGFNVHADVLTQTADGVNLNVLWQEFEEALNAWNSGRTPIAALFTYQTIDSSDTLYLDSPLGEFEKVSEFGVPQAQRSMPNGYLVGFPLDEYDTATRFTRRYLRDASADQVRSIHSVALEADNHLVFKNTMAALTTPLLAGSRPPNREGVSVYSLYAGSADDKPPAFAGRTFGANHNHYLVSGAATIDGGDLKALTDHVQHHGYGLPANGERVIIVVHPNEGAIIRTLRRDPDDNPAAPVNPFDFIPSVSAPAYLTDETIVGDQPPATFNSLPIIGSYGDAWITESYFMPTGYAIAVGTAGPGSVRNPLAFRQHVTPDQRGLLLLPAESGSTTYPLLNAYYTRTFGVGVRNRGAAAVMQIKASGSYDPPTWS